MKKLVIVCLLAACELQPAPKPAPTAGSAAPIADAAGSAVATARPVVPPDAGAATPPPAVQPTADCEKAAIRYADLAIAGAPAAQRGIYEQDRAKTVRLTEVACTQQGWSAPALACIAQSKTDRDARACLVKFPASGVSPSDAGSNAKPR